ncbi:hypothetical protein FB451DRAFT_1379598 [Mycena latifolia]|nr:hypothetical protein FB451DRAFT_1379598 [Mycena latifolia]
MAEALGTIASVLQLVDTALKARGYLKDFHNAPKEQRQLFSEVEILQSLLMELDKRANGKAAGDTSTFKQMLGPLATFEAAMECLTKLLVPADGLSKFTKRVTWTLWSKKEAVGYLQELERMKALIHLWLNMDIWDGSQKQMSHQDMFRAESAKDEKRQRIFDLMSPLNFLQRQADVFSNLQPGTGEWLLSEPKFQEWESGSGKVLLCQGIRQCTSPVARFHANLTQLVLGRLSLRGSLVVDHLEARRTNNIGLACIYLNHKDTKSQTVTNLLGALWRQLMLGKPIPPTVHTLYNYHGERGTRPRQEEVCAALKVAVGECSKAYFIIDALDEYPDPHRNLFLKYLAVLVPEVNVMLTSRPHINLEANFPNLQILEIYATEDDIHKFFDMQTQNSFRLSKHIQSCPELYLEIQSQIIRYSRGMFLLAKLHIESLATKTTIKAVREALQHLPKDLQHTYDEAIHRIHQQTEEDRQLGLLALTWVANAKRPLSVEELREAMAIEPGSTSLDIDNLLDIDIILSVCAGMIIVDKTICVVRLIHYTAQDYLDGIQPLQFPFAQTIIVNSCLRYLSFKDFENLPAFWKERRDLVATHPFLQYAQYCLLHAKGQPELCLQDEIINFLTGASRWMYVWNPWHGVTPWDCLFLAVDGSHHRPFLSDAPLLFAAACNLEIIARYLVVGGVPTSIKTRALSVASYYGHIDMVKLLIDEGADANALGGGFAANIGNPLQIASLRGYASVVQLLIQEGADVNAHGGPYRSALLAASSKGHELVVRLLIERGADINLPTGRLGNALQVASALGYESVVKLLIQKGADVNIEGGWHGNALQAATSNGHKPVVQLLIDKGTNVNAQGEMQKCMEIL